MNPKDFWNARYEQADYMYGTAPNDFLAASLPHFPDKARVLCLAEGEGRNAVFLAKQGFDVHAFDISDAGQAKANRLAQEHGVPLTYTVCDVNDFDFGQDQWDAIVSISAHTDPDTRRKTLKKALAGLKQGGIFLLEAYHPNQIEQGYNTGGPKQTDWLVTLAELQEAFAGQNIRHQAALEREVHEGQHHTGKAFVTQFICAKR